MNHDPSIEIIDINKELDDATDKVFQAIELLRTWVSEVATDKVKCPELCSIIYRLRNVGRELDEYDPANESSKSLIEPPLEEDLNNMKI